LEQHIDEDELERYVRDFYSDDIYNEPDSYFNEDQRDLSDSQQEEINRKERTIGKLNLQISGLEDELDGENDDDINEKIDEMNEMISELEEEIEEIKNNPEGDFPDELIESEIENRIQDVMRDPQWFISDFGLDIKNFINERDFAQAVVDEDGVGVTLNRYDGSADLITINNVDFYVMRID
jgi:DNA repair exonuclease SbcCD ATPase subunit